MWNDTQHPPTHYLARNGRQEMGMNGRRMFRRAVINIDDEDHPLDYLYMEYKKEFPNGDPLICACEKTG